MSEFSTSALCSSVTREVVAFWWLLEKCKLFHALRDVKWYIKYLWSANLVYKLISVNTRKSHKGMASKFYDYESTWLKSLYTPTYYI